MKGADNNYQNNEFVQLDSKRGGFGPKLAGYQRRGFRPNGWVNYDYPRELTRRWQGAKIPDGIGVFSNFSVAREQDLGVDYINAGMSKGFPAAGNITWYGYYKGPDGTGANLNWDSSGFASLQGVSREASFFFVNDRFPYLSGQQAHQILQDTARFRAIEIPNNNNPATDRLASLPLSNVDSDWMGWDVEDMAKALTGPAELRGAVTVDMSGQGRRMSNGRVCTDPFAAGRPGGISVCERDTWLNVLSGSGGLHKMGRGQLVLAAENTFTGGLMISGGAIVITLAANLGAASGGLTLDGGGLEFGRGFVFSRPVNVGSGGGTFNAGASPMTIDSVISGSGAVRKQGTGTLFLEGANTYTGDTVVEEGGSGGKRRPGQGGPDAHERRRGGFHRSQRCDLCRRHIRRRHVFQEGNGGAVPGRSRCRRSVVHSCRPDQDRRLLLHRRHKPGRQFGRD